MVWEAHRDQAVVDVLAVLPVGEGLVDEQTTTIEGLGRGHDKAAGRVVDDRPSARRCEHSSSRTERTNLGRHASPSKKRLMPAGRVDVAEAQAASASIASTRSVDMAKGVG